MAFWDLTPREVLAILHADAARRLRDFDERRFLDHNLAHLLAFSYHEPGKMPEFHPSGKGEAPSPEPKKSTDAEITQALGYFMSMSLRADR